MFQNSISLVPFCCPALCRWRRMRSSALTPGCCTALSSGAGGWPSAAGDPSGDTPPPPATPRFWPAGGEGLPFPQTASALEFQTLEKRTFKQLLRFVGTHSAHIVSFLHTPSIALASQKY